MPGLLRRTTSPRRHPFWHAPGWAKDDRRGRSTGNGGAMTEDGRLAPIVAALRSGFGTSTRLPGLAPDLVVGDPAGWTSGADLSGPGVEGLLKAARERWDAPDHIAAAVTWKAYSYWLAVPAVLGWMS